MIKIKKNLKNYKLFKSEEAPWTMALSNKTACLALVAQHRIVTVETRLKHTNNKTYVKKDRIIYKDYDGTYKKTVTTYTENGVTGSHESLYNASTIPLARVEVYADHAEYINNNIVKGTQVMCNTQDNLTFLPDALYHHGNDSLNLI